MATDRMEQSRRGMVQRKTAAASSSAEARQFVQIKTVVTMSDAYRDCDYSARCVLLELCARLKWVSGQPEPTNNGRLWLSREEWTKAGFAPATVTRALKQLVKVGLIYRARSGGIGRGCSEYALTFYAPTKDTDGLFFQGFRKNAWSSYKAEPKKIRESNLNRDRFKNDELPAEMGKKQIKTEQAPVIKSVHQEAESTNLTVKTPLYRVAITKRHRLHDHTNSPRPLPKAGRDYLRLVA
jgi:hypothetical protein